MQEFRQHIVFRIFWIIMAIHVLNCSVDMPDSHPENIPEDLTFNEMESVAEIVLEKVFNLDNAVAEHDENDAEERGKSDLKKEIIFYHINKTSCLLELINRSNKISSEFKEPFISEYVPEISSPPPKA